MGDGVESTDLAQRYGTGPHDQTRRRWWIAGTAAALLALFIGWLAWSGSATSPGNLLATDTAHTIIDAHRISVSFEVNVDPGHPVSCALQALSPQFAVVGWKVVSLPASEHRTRTVTEDLRTTQRSTTGLISRCWLT
ncbi:MAG: DUF4307 domain-containing protein [Microbacteriaceae bacterium]